MADAAVAANADPSYPDKGIKWGKSRTMHLWGIVTVITKVRTNAF